MDKTVLLVGGAGYIGSHTAHLLYQQGCKVIILDKFIHGQPFNHSWATVVKGDFADKSILSSIFTNNSIDAVMHFAAFIEVGESVKRPLQFYENNVIKTFELLNSMLLHNVKKIIFSSSCAVYGVPQYIPLNESHHFAPISTYGKNKAAVEYMLQDYAVAYGLQFVALRYFNAAGADTAHGLGEWHCPETHVLPLLLRSMIQDKEFSIYGDDYDTDDGSCVRDYVHVQDIAHAHVLAYEYLCRGNASEVFNLGSGIGYTVKKIIAAIEKIHKKGIRVLVQPRRVGDVPVLVADYKKAKKILGWQPLYSALENIIKSAYAWEVERIKKESMHGGVASKT